MAIRPLRIGTRGSPMALYQAELVRDRLRAAHPELAAEGALELVPIRTTGDRVQTRLLAEIGGKGLFTKEIEEALLDRRIDLAVHSLKDMETYCPPGSGDRVRAAARRSARCARGARRRPRRLAAGRPHRHRLVAPPGAIVAPPSRSRDRPDARQCEYQARQARCWRGRRAGAGAVRPRTPRQSRPRQRNPVAGSDAAGGRPGRPGGRMPRRG